MFAGALRRGVSADDELLFVDTLELDPCAASPSRFINGGALFADNPFQTAPLHFFEKPLCIAANGARKTDWVACIGAEFLQNVFPRFQRQPNQALAVDLEEIECIIIDWRFSSFHFARLQELKRGTTLIVERNHFAIDQAFARW